MILTGREIHRCVQTGEIVIDPFKPEHCNPNSYNFHLGPKLLVYDGAAIERQMTEAGESCRVGLDGGLMSWHLETRRQNPTREIVIPPEGIVLQPGKLYLGSTVEKMGSRKFAPIMAARSSLGRLGLFIFLNSGLGDIGFVGQWTLELFVIHPLLLRAGDRIGQLMFFQSVGDLVQYTGKYQSSEGPQPSQIYKDQASSSIYKKPTRLLLDAGGVLLSDGTAVDRLIQRVASESDTADKVVRAFWKDAVRELLWTGAISLDYALGLMNGRFGTKCKWEKQEISPLPWAAEALALHPQSWILSNHLDEWLGEALAKIPGLTASRFVDLAGRVLVSNRIGALKPHAAAYHAALERMKAEASEVLFVDNKADNLEAAGRIGMHTLLADPEGQWVARAREILEVQS